MKVSLLILLLFSSPKNFPDNNDYYREKITHILSIENLLTDSTYITTNSKGQQVETIYFSNGNIKSEKTIIKSIVGAKGYSFIKYKYDEWNETGKKMTKKTVKTTSEDSYYKIISWIFRENGKFTIKRKKEKQIY